MVYNFRTWHVRTHLHRIWLIDNHYLRANLSLPQNQHNHIRFAICSGAKSNEMKNENHFKAIENMKSTILCPLYKDIHLTVLCIKHISKRRWSTKLKWKEACLWSYFYLKRFPLKVAAFWMLLSCWCPKYLLHCIFLFLLMYDRSRRQLSSKSWR